MKPATKDAFKLMHEGALALSQVEANGIRVDTKYLTEAIAKITEEMKGLVSEIKQSRIYKKWKRKYGEKTKLGSDAQLGDILFNEMKFKCYDHTDTGRPKTDEEALSKVDDPVVRLYVRWKKRSKLRSTYLEGVQREVIDGYAHCIYNLHLAKTYRSSCEAFNFQNQPIRDIELAGYIRPAYIPRSKHRRLVEADFGGIEVCGAACYNKDPMLISYIKDKSKDMHRDMASECYILKTEDVSKLARYAAKNRFVFPEFYGSFFRDCAPNLWAAIDELDLKGPDDIPLKKHLKSKGIRELGATFSNRASGRIETKKGTFMEHIRNVEKDFWERRFKVYTEWKKDWWDLYCERGWFRLLTGFVCQGVYKRNDVINYPVQGASFHMLLWCLIEIVKKLKRYKMRSLVVGQIHDSILGDVPDRELKSYCEIIRETMLEDLPNHWKWICVPLSVEIEVTEPGCSWHTKKEYKG